MRVIGGTAKGMKLQSPKGTEVRPMLDRVKEALFNILSNRIPGAEVLDLFAGTGSLGIEALSRGAKGVVFVESDPRCVESIGRNLEHTRLGEKAVTIRCNALHSLRPLEKLGRSFDMVFLDPPYAMTASASAMRPLEELLGRAAAKGILASETILMIHHGRRVFGISSGLPFEVCDERWYGKSGLAFLRLRKQP